MKFALSALFFSHLVQSAFGAGEDGYTYFEDGGLGPSNWAFLQLEGNQCGGTLGQSGFGQSPVTIDEAIGSTCDTNMAQYQFTPGTCKWSDLKFSINNGGVKVKPINECSFGQMNIPHSTNDFNAIQFHIHTFSEHQILGQGDKGYFPAELHVVHLEDGAPFAAVFGTMISVGSEPHPMFEWFLQGWEAVAQAVEDECVEGTSDLTARNSLVENFQCQPIGSRTIFNGTEPAFPDEAVNVYDLPTNPNFGTYTYKGGLTTPACTEIVNWNLLDTPMEISADQLERLKYLILCYISQTTDEVDGSLKSCGFGTVASQTGSTSRPPQPLLGRRVLHRCPDGPDVVIDDIGVTVEDAKIPGSDFVKPEREMEPLNTKEGDCSRSLFDGCNEDPRYNPEVSPNLKYNAESWYDAEGFWVGTITSYDARGQPASPTFASSQVENTYPYDRSNMRVFMNRTISETRFFERTHLVMGAADSGFCGLPIPDGGANVLGGGTCGQTGYAVVDERFGTATFEKDGTVQIFMTKGIYGGESVSGEAAPIGDNSIFSLVKSSKFEHSYTEAFGNAEKTSIVGTGQALIFADVPPYSLNPLAETFAYSMTQVSEADFVNLLGKAYNDERVPTEDIPVVSSDPTEAEFRRFDPVYAQTPYEDDPDVTSGYIVLFIIFGLFFTIGALYLVHQQLAAQQAARIQESFSRRIASTVTLKGGFTAETLAKEFKAADKDGNGTLDKEELRAFMGGKMDARDFESMFAAMDIDHNGTVDYAEFCAFVTHIEVPGAKKSTTADLAENQGDEKVFHS